jgi:glucokinase
VSVDVAPNADAVTVLINGRPASGKSTLAPRLGEALGLPTISRDAIKETHADVLGCEHPTLSQREWNRRLSAAASESAWTLLATMPNGAVIEAPYPVDVRHYVHKGLARAGIRNVVEIWCEVPFDLAVERDKLRHGERHPIHGELGTEAEWSRWRDIAQPIGAFPLLRVDTTRAVDVRQVAEWVETQRRLVADGQLGQRADLRD